MEILIDRLRGMNRGLLPQMDRFVKARWTGIVPPTIIKQAGVFIFVFQSHEDLTKVYESFTYFLFDKPLLLKKLEPGIRITKQLFKQTPVWIRLPDLRLEV